MRNHLALFLLFITYYFSIPKGGMTNGNGGRNSKTLVRSGKSRISNGYVNYALKHLFRSTNGVICAIMLTNKLCGGMVYGN